MFFNLPRDVIRSTARFILRVHTLLLRVETATLNQRKENLPGSESHSPH